jgi:hypothetical protein
MLKNLSPRFIEELGSPNPQPFAILEIQSKGQEDEATTEAQWGAATGETTVDYDATARDITSATYRWILSGSGTNEYYTELAAGGDRNPLIPEQYILMMDGVWLTKGALGSLADHEWGYGDNDSKGFNTIYVADATGDPDDNAQVILTHGTPPTSGDVILAQDPDSTTGTAPVYPIDEGGSTEVTGTWSDVDAPESDAGYLVGGIGTDHSWYGQPGAVELLDLARTIKSVTLGFRVGGDGGGSGTFKPFIRIGGASYVDTTLIPCAAPFSEATSVLWESNPATNLPWKSEDIATIQDIGLLDWDVSGGNCWVSVIRMIVTYFDFVATGSITVELDLGASVTTSNNAVFSIDDNVPTDTGLTYTLEGSTVSGGPWDAIDLGSIVDGSSVAGYRYYRPTASFTGDGNVTPILKSIKVEIPDRIYRLTSRSGGIFGALPYLSGIPGRTISIDLKDFVTLGSDLKAGLQKDEYVIQMLRENYFKNLHASVQIGMYREDITEADLTYTFQGKVSGYTVGMEEVSISLKDGTKDLSAKWPAGISITKDGTHMVDVINTIMDDVGIAARYINRGSLDTLKNNVGDGSPSPSNYVVYRGSSPPIASGDTTLTEPETAKKVVGELLELLGAYMVSQEDGRIYVVEYASGDASIGDPWTEDDFLEDPVYNPDVENIINDTFIYFDWNGEGTAADDFTYLHPSPDNTSITNWGETNTRVIKSKWLAGSAADEYYGEELAIHIGARETERRKNGMGIFPVKTLLSKFEIQVGDMIDVDAADLIINPDVGEGDVRKFMVVSKKPNWENFSISWSLVEAR